MADRDQIVEQALSLAPEDRAYVADALEQSLSSGSFASAEIAAAWAHEIERRLAGYDRGEIKAVDADIVLERIRQHLAEQKSKG
jgi:putative addiction module component (TIGR02574 family)